MFPPEGSHLHFPLAKTMIHLFSVLEVRNCSDAKWQLYVAVVLYSLLFATVCFFCICPLSARLIYIFFFTLTKVKRRKRRLFYRLVFSGYRLYHLDFFIVFIASLLPPPSLYGAIMHLRHLAGGVGGRGVADVVQN